MRKKYKARRNPKPENLLIECIDPRFAEAFEEFREYELGVKGHRDIVVRIGGALTPLAYPVEMPSRFKGIRKWLEFKCRKFPSIVRIIAIAHSDCGYYHDQVPDSILQSYHRDCGIKENDEGIEKRDSPLIGSFLQVLFPQKKVEVYHANLIESTYDVFFDPVPCGPKEPAVVAIEQWSRQRQRVLQS